MGAEGAGDPLNRAALFHQRTLGIQVVHVLRPVFNRRVAEFGPLLDVQLHAASVEVCHVVLRRGAALNEVQARALVHDDERVLKLAGALGIQAEVGLQGNGEVHALGHVHERAAGPHRAVERRELVIVGRHELHEVLAHHVGIFALYGALHIGVNHALGRHGILDVVIDKLGVVLRTHTGEGFSLRLRDAKALEGLLDVLRHVLPVVAHLGVRANVGRDMIHIKALN